MSTDVTPSATPALTRVEVIDASGRAYVRWGVDVTYDLQDDGRTLKVFVREPF